jgi:hypothetical protein
MVGGRRPAHQPRNNNRYSTKEPCDQEPSPDDGEDFFPLPPVVDSDDEDIDLDAISAPSIFDLDKKAQFYDCGVHRTLASCELDVDPD